MTTPEQRELEHLRRLVAAYRELHREAWRPVEKPWSEVKAGAVVLDRNGTARMVERDNGYIYVRAGNRRYPIGAGVAPTTATVRVLAPIPPNMTDLLLASELGAACARVDGES